MPIEKKRIAKNTLFLYFRMMITMIVSLYTSRVVLKILGVDDFGIYQTVGGIVAVLMFVNSALSVGSSRFLTFELGTRDFAKLKETFSTVLSVHIILALAIVVVAETFGLWYVYNKLVVSPERFDAAVFAYHISVLTTFITIIQVPYSASIVSHERMKVFAYVSIVDVLLKLAIVYLLTISDFDKLKVYACLLFLIHFGIVAFYRIYCKNHFSECCYSVRFNKEIFKKIFAYSGWNLFASSAHALCNQGVLVLLNLFFSAPVVAARALANQVNNAALAFVSNFRTAVNPQVVKLYAAQNFDESRVLLLESTKYSFYLMLVLCVPITMVAVPLLQLWLGEVPDYAPEFLIWTVLTSLVAIFDESFYVALYAKGNIRNNSLISSSILFLGFVTMYFCFKLGCSPIACVIILFIVRFILGTVVKPILLVKIVGYPLKPILRVIAKSVSVGCIAWLLPILFHFCIGNIQMSSFFKFIFEVLFSLVCTLSTIWIIGLGPDVKQKLIQFLYAKMGKKYG